MKRLAMFVLLGLFAVAAFAVEGTYMPSGAYGLFWGGPDDVNNPDFTIFFSTAKGPPRTLTETVSGKLYTWDASDELYRSSDGDTWYFDGCGHGTFTDWPAPPAYGPGVPTNGLVFR